MTQIYDLIQSIQGTQANDQSKGTKESTGEIGGKSFGDTLGDFLDVVNARSKASSEQAMDVIQGRSDSLAEAMIAMEESKMSFQLMLEIRTKLLESYTEISRMQV